MDIMNPDFMDDNVIMIASMMFNIADRKERLSADYIIPPSTPKWLFIYNNDKISFNTIYSLEFNDLNF